MNAVNHTPTSVTVRPCPFCGGDDMVTVEINPADGQSEAFLGCCSCGAKGPSTIQGEEKAVEAWNTRAVTAPRHRPADVLTGKDRRNIGDALSIKNIHIEHVLPLHAAPDEMSLYGGWEALGDALREWGDLEDIFRPDQREELADSLENDEMLLCALRRIGGWVLIGSYATVGNITLKEDGRFASCSVYCGIEHEFIVWGRTYKRAIARAINEQRHYFNGEVEKAREAAGYGRA